MKKVFIFLILCLALSAQAQISNIPKQDLKEIEFLFDYLISEHDFAYTLFGSKPMSLADLSLRPPCRLPATRQNQALNFRKKLMSSLKAWDKYKKHFKSQDFIILDSEDGFFSCTTFFIIHKNNLLSLLKNHESLFKQELGSAFTPETFLEKLEKRETTLAEAIHTNDKLLGIMLGYGVRNASLFQERLDLKKALVKSRQLSAPIKELTKRLSIVEAQMSDFSVFEENAVIPPLYFLADASHPETIELKEKYEKERLKLIHLKQQPKFIECALKRLLTTSSVESTK